METGSVMRASGEGVEAVPPRRPRSFVEWRDLLISAFGPASVLLLAYLLYQMVLMVAGTGAEYTNDFQIFHKVGQLIWKGDLTTAYDIRRFSAIQAVALGQPHVMTSWAYPPQFDLIAAGLGLMRMIPGYVLFMSLTFALYALVLRRLGEGRFGWAMTFVFPAMVVTISSGQNGFLTGALAGAFALGFLNRDARAGIPLGLLVIKPHLAVGLCFVALLRRRYDMLAWALATAAVSGAVATLAFGPDVWPAFLHGVREASHYLALGLFPLYRMTSVYAAVLTLGTSASLAMALQLSVAAGAFFVLWRLHRGRVGDETLLGLTLIATLLVSPYAYDYDMTIFAFGLALLAPELSHRLRPAETIVLVVLSWTATSWGLAGNILIAATKAEASVDPVHPYLSVAGLLYPALFFMIAWVVTRHEAEATRPIKRT